MNSDTQKKEEFERIAAQMIAWLRANANLHTLVIIDWDSAKVVSDEFNYLRSS